MERDSFKHQGARKSIQPPKFELKTPSDKGIELAEQFIKKNKIADHRSERYPLITIKENNLTKTDVPNRRSELNPPLAIKEKYQRTRGLVQNTIMQPQDDT